MESHLTLSAKGGGGRRAVGEALEEGAAVLREGIESATDGLPKTTRESIDMKLSAYLLEPNHPVGGSKAKWFEEALGFTKDNSNLFAEQMVFDFDKATKTIANEYGTKFSQVISIQGVNGKIIDVEFIWIKNNDGVIRFVTSIPTKK